MILSTFDDNGNAIIDEIFKKKFVLLNLDPSGPDFDQV